MKWLGKLLESLLSNRRVWRSSERTKCLEHSTHSNVLQEVQVYKLLCLVPFSRSQIMRFRNTTAIQLVLHTNLVVKESQNRLQKSFSLLEVHSHPQRQLHLTIRKEEWIYWFTTLLDYNLFKDFPHKSLSIKLVRENQSMISINLS